MNYNEIEAIDDLPNFLLEGLSTDTKYRMWSDLKTTIDWDLFSPEDVETSVDELVQHYLFQHFYTAAWNLLISNGWDPEKESIT